MENGGPARLDIGSTLKQTRQRLGLEIREVEERTKIRIKYLRALENEEWDVLPAPAYVRGYLRAYADLLELDGEVLADEYRRQFEDATPQSTQAVGAVLSERRREEGPRLSRGALVAGIVATIVIVLLILAIVGGSDDGSTESSAPATGLPQSGQPAVGETRLIVDRRAPSPSPPSVP